MSLTFSKLKNHLENSDGEVEINGVKLYLHEDQDSIHLGEFGFICDHKTGEEYNILNDFYFSGLNAKDLKEKIKALIEFIKYCTEQFDCGYPDYYIEMATFSDSNIADNPVVDKKSEDPIAEQFKKENIELKEANAKISVYKEIIGGSSITIQK